MDRGEDCGEDIPVTGLSTPLSSSTSSCDETLLSLLSITFDWETSMADWPLLPLLDDDLLIVSCTVVFSRLSMTDRCTSVRNAACLIRTLADDNSSSFLRRL